MLCTAFALLALCISGTSASAQDVNSGNHMLPSCKALTVKGDASEPFAQGICSGTIDGLFYAGAGLCPPDGVTVGQMTRVVVKYLEQNPQRLHEDFKKLALEAMRRAWPCR